MRLTAFALVCATAVLVGCAKGPEVDAHRNAVVVEKIDPTGDVDYGVLRVVTQDDEQRLLAFSLTEDPARPLAYIWGHIQVGSNLAFAYLDMAGKPKYLPDGIFALTTADIVLLDKPDDLEQMIGLATDRRRARLLADEQEREALWEVWEQVHQPKE